VLSDYEMAVESALPQVFTHSFQHKGCYFHYSQALYKRIKEMGMGKAMETSYAFYEWFTKLKVLPLVVDRRLNVATGPGHALCHLEYRGTEAYSDDQSSI